MGSEYRIRIVTEATGTGARDTRDELKQIRDEAGKVEKAVDAVDPLEDLAKEARAGFADMRERVAALNADLANTRGFDSVEDAADDALDTIEELEAELRAVNAQLEKTKIGSTRFDELSARSKELKSSIAGARNEQSGFAGAGLKKLAGLAAGYISLQAAVKAVTGSIRLAAAEEQQAQRIRQAGANKGIFDPGFVDEIRQFGEEMEKALGVSDAAIENAVQRLLPDVDASELRGSLEVIENLTPLYGNIEGATNAWTKALKGNFDSLREQGFVLDATADKTEKLADIQRQAATRGAGLLRANSESLSSEWDRLKDNAGDVAASFGGVITEGLQLSQIMGGVADALSDVSGRSSDAAANLEQFSTVDDGLEQRKTEALAFAASLSGVAEAVAESEAALNKQIGVLKSAKAAEDALAKAVLDRQIAEVQASELKDSDKAERIGKLKGAASQQDAQRSLALIKAEEDARIQAIEESEKRITEAQAKAREAEQRKLAASTLEAQIAEAQKGIAERERQIEDAVPKTNLLAALAGVAPQPGQGAPSEKVKAELTPEIEDLRRQIEALQGERDARGLGTTEAEVIRSQAATASEESVSETARRQIEENRELLEELRRERDNLVAIAAQQQQTQQIRSQSSVDRARKVEGEQAELRRQQERDAQREQTQGIGESLARALQGEALQANNPGRAQLVVDRLAQAVEALGSGQDLGRTLDGLLPLIERLNQRANGLEAQTKAQAERFQREIQRLQQTVKNNR